jgi:hypothetical protein
LEDENVAVELDTESATRDRDEDALGKHLEVLRFSRNKVRLAVASRIEELRNLILEEGDPDIRIDSSAVGSLVLFALVTNFRRKPQLGVTDAGTITAQWHGSDQQTMSLHFLPGYIVQYAYIGPRPPIARQAYGAVPTARVAHVLDSFRALDWM